MKKKLVITDKKACMACLECVQACSNAFYKVFDPDKACIRITAGPDLKPVPKLCVQCGKCARTCPQQAISIRDGVAVVNRSRCVSCGLCVKACPRGLISLIPESRIIRVQCSNRDKGPMVKKACAAGCIGCGLGAKQCESDAIEFDGTLARINPEKCTLCGKCAEKCPVKVITRTAV